MIAGHHLSPSNCSFPKVFLLFKLFLTNFVFLGLISEFPVNHNGKLQVSNFLCCSPSSLCVWWSRQVFCQPICNWFCELCLKWIKSKSLWIITWSEKKEGGAKLRPPPGSQVADSVKLHFKLQPPTKSGRSGGREVKIS